MPTHPLNIVILAAGQGTRMRSRLPKVLHKLAGKPFLEHLISTAQTLQPQNIFVVYGHAGDQVRAALAHLPVQWIEQSEQLGTGHAVMQALPHIPDGSRVLVLVGDIPLLSPVTLQKFVAEVPPASIGMLTIEMPDPTGLGRVLRNENHQVTGIVEQKDATQEQLIIKEVNTGIFLTDRHNFQRWLPQVKNHNAQREYYLPDVIALAVQEKIPVVTIPAACPEEVQGINDRIQLAKLERFHQRQQAEILMRNGVTLHDPNRFDVRGTLQCGIDVVIDINVIFEGEVEIGDNCTIGANCFLKNVKLGNNVSIKPMTVLENCSIDDDCSIGPFARLRPDTKLARAVRVGNFVELKKTEVGEYSKINHLSYVGDATIGSKVNVGAGTITCNYDGVNKHQTTIGDNVFIGANTALIAPITIGENATVAAGSAVRGIAPADALTIERSDQRTISDWVRPQKKQE